MPPKKLNRPQPESADSTPDLSQDDLKSLAQNKDSPEAKLSEAASRAEAALNAQKTASSLRSAAATIKDPAKRDAYLRDAYNKEIEAHGNSKKARVLSSGAFQGGVGGGGIGMAVGAGLGTLVGTVVGTVATVPTTAVGTLVGMGVGGVHGPWVKLGKMGKGDAKGEGKEGDEGKTNEKQDGAVEEEGIPDPAALREAADKVAEARKNGELDGDSEAQKKERKKPRKIEVRGKQAATASG